MSWFFSRTKVDFADIHTDIHSHMIPGIDDGSDNMQETITLIKGMSDLGYKKMILTPHVRYGSFDNDTRQFDSRLEEVKIALKEAGVDMQLEVGAEQTIDEGFMEHFERGELKSFGKKKYLLIEFSFYSLPMNIKDIIFQLQREGYRLILAHPERYLYLRTDTAMLEYLRDSGILFQLNILSLVGFYNKAVEQFAKYLIKNDYIDLVGTDLHHQKHLDGIIKAQTNKTLYKLIESGRLMNNMF